MVRRLFSKIGWGKFLLLWGFSLAFGLSCRTNQKTTLLVHLLTVLNDQYYFIFAVLPILLFFCGSVMEDESELVILRYGRYSRYWDKWQPCSYPVWEPFQSKDGRQTYGLIRKTVYSLCWRRFSLVLLLHLFAWRFISWPDIA